MVSFETKKDAEYCEILYARLYALMKMAAILPFVKVY